MTDVLAFDGRMGASGDMLLGALLAAGADRAALEPVEDALDVAYEVRDAEKNGIAATNVTVRHLDADGGHDGDDRGDHGRSRDRDDSSRDHDHAHEHDHDRDDPSRARDDAHPHDDAEGHGPHRTYPEVVDLVESMDLPGPVESDALGAFERLGEAEARVHGTDLESTHFHEVGADDAVADVVGVCLLVHDLDPARVVTAPVAAGGGTVEMSHGTYPVPAPAVVNVAEGADWDLKGGPVESELLTPTGAALLAQLAEGVDALPPMRVRASGYGAGAKDFPAHPNVLRALRGDGRGGLRQQDVAVLETNVDDVSPEVLGGLQSTLADAGALDVSVVPLTMKKSRPGHLVRVVAAPEDAERVARRLAEETGTLGVREGGASHRWIADRELREATVALDGEEYALSVKVATDAAGEVFDVSAEYDEAERVAREAGVPVRRVLRAAEAAVE